MASDEDQLIATAVNGDKDALTQLLERHALSVRNRLDINSKWLPYFDRDDVMQVTFLEAFLRITEFVPRRSGSFAAWLRRIAGNNMQDAIRSLERKKRPGPDRRVDHRRPDDESYVETLSQLGFTSTTPSRVAGRDEAKGILEGALHQLPPDYERVMRLYYLDERSVEETAKAMNRSSGAVKMLLARARDRLSELLGTGSQFFSHSA